MPEIWWDANLLQHGEVPDDLKGQAFDESRLFRNVNKNEGACNELAYVK